jgi:DNA modification methylase
LQNNKSIIANVVDKVYLGNSIIDMGKTSPHKLILNKNNPRFIKDDKFAQLVKSIKDFPEMLEKRPIVVDEDLVVLGGNMRLRACRDAGLKEVPYIIAEGWTDEQKAEFIIKDNVGYGSWQWDTLFNEWDVDLLQDWGLELPSDLALDEPEVEEHEADEPTDAMQVDVVLGDVIEIGRHRLVCGDSTDVGAVDKLMGSIAPQWIHTDPPYGMNAVSKSSVLSKNYSEDILGDSDNTVAISAFDLCNSLYKDVKQCWWGANYYSEVLPSSECWLVWDKNNGGSDQTDAELAWTNYRSVVRKFTQSSEKTNRVHPTQKPVSLVQWAFDKSNLKKIKVVADFFGGSGVTMVWAEQVGADSFLIELDPKYCQVIINRMVKAFEGIEVKINGKVYNG